MSIQYLLVVEIIASDPDLLIAATSDRNDFQHALCN